MVTIRLRSFVAALASAAAFVLVPATAHADITVFFGAGHTPVNRTAQGLSLGVTMMVVGFEVEYSDISEKTADVAPRLRTGMINAIVQTPTSGAQLYATAGAGAYRESLLSGHRETNTGVNIGAGLKMNLLGPLRLRVDYRLFRLRGDARHSTVHRVYAGVNAAF